MRTVEGVQFLTATLLVTAAFVVAASNGTFAQVAGTTTTTNLSPGCSTVTVTSGTNVQVTIDCTVHEGTIATVSEPAGFPFPPFLNVFGLQECGTACPNPLPIADVSDLLTISSSTSGGVQTISFVLLSDTDSESGTCWVPQEGGNCIPLNTGTLFTQAEDTSGMALFPFCKTTTISGVTFNVCANITTVSDGAGSGEIIESTPGVPQFGLPAVVVAATGLAFLAYMRVRTRKVLNA